MLRFLFVFIVVSVSAAWAQSSYHEVASTKQLMAIIHGPTYVAVTRVANRAISTRARSCVPSATFSFSSKASTRKLTLRLSAEITSDRKVTLIPIGVAATWAT